MPDLNVVTGAFGFTGRRIASRLLARGELVKTITGHPDSPNDFGGQIDAVPFYFDAPDKLAAELTGVKTLYNTYWVRFGRGKVTFEGAIRNIKTLVQAAKEAGVQRLVHVSITNPSLDSPYPYFNGKAQVERAVRESGLSYAIVRPAFVFGEGDVLLNNIAWMLRRFPIFVVPGTGEYLLQPIYVEDLARLAVESADKSEDLVVDAIGPDTLSFNELVDLTATAIGSRARVLHLPSKAALFFSRVIGRALNDVVLTWDEVGGLRDNLLFSEGAPTGAVSLREWLLDRRNASALGAEYASELQRHYLR